MDRENKDQIEFYDDFPYAVLLLSWDGLRIIRCKTQEYMEQVYMEMKQCYTYVQKIEVKNIA